jgi:hypothetical protein
MLAGMTVEIHGNAKRIMMLNASKSRNQKQPLKISCMGTSRTTPDKT